MEPPIKFTKGHTSRVLIGNPRFMPLRGNSCFLALADLIILLRVLLKVSSSIPSSESSSSFMSDFSVGADHIGSSVGAATAGSSLEVGDFFADHIGSSVEVGDFLIEISDFSVDGKCASVEVSVK